MKNILCIDIGGTRIKSAVFPEKPSLEQVKTTAPLAIRTLGWLNHSLPDLLKPDHWAGLASHYEHKGVSYDRIAVSVPGPVDEQGCFDRADLVDGPAKIQKRLRNALEEAAGKPVTLIKDADAWMLGFLRYAALIEENFKYPALILAFGTGVGVSAATGPDTIHSIEISRCPVTAWPKLQERSHYEITEGWHIHRILGRPYFEWVEREHREWSYLTMRQEFSTRVEAALHDLRPLLEPRLGRYCTVILAGGNAEFVSVRGLSKSLDCRVIDLTDHGTLLKPDLISLLGVEAASRAAFPRQFE